jgi:DNA-binding transcriptional LysR family regulator
MTYDQLHAFLAVAAGGAFTAASATLHKSQPAVSKLVRNLEDELGLTLFDRRQYRATLTDAGRLFQARAAAVVEQTEALKTLARELAGDVEPLLRLAVDAVTPLGPITSLLRTAQERFPTVRFELSTERLAGAAAALDEGRADLAIATRLGTRTTNVERAAFARVRILPVARAGHPVAEAVPPSPALLRSHPQIVLRDSAHVADAPSINVLEGGLRWSVTDVSTKKDLILAGMGWGGLPEHVVASEVAAGELVALDVPEFETDTMALFVLRRRDRARGVVAQALWQALRDAARDASGAGHQSSSSAARVAPRRTRVRVARPRPKPATRGTKKTARKKRRH